MVALVVLGLAVACSSDHERPRGSGPDRDGVRIASFDFAESELMSELYAQVLEARDIPVARVGRAGPREVVAPALEQGRIDLVPEYLGTASAFFGAATSDSDTSTSQARLADLLAPRGLLPLQAAPAQDANAVVVHRTFADRTGVSTISDLAGIDEPLRFGGPVECPERPLCLLGLADTYGLTFAEFAPQRRLAHTAEALRRGEVDVGLMFTTAAELADDDIVELVDDRGLQPPENLVPVVRMAAANQWGAPLSDALDELSAALTTEDLRQMNAALVDGVPVADVAAAWLDEVGLVRR